MLATEGMIEALNADKSIIDFKEDYVDHELDKVLDFCDTTTIQGNKLRYSDGQEKTFSFDKQKH